MKSFKQIEIKEKTLTSGIFLPWRLQLTIQSRFVDVYLGSCALYKMESAQTSHGLLFSFGQIFL